MLERRHYPVALALALATLGAGVPLVMMVNGSLAHDIDYLWWTWWAIPAVWIPSAGGALLALRHPAPGALLWTAAAGIGIGIFWRELGLLTFGALWLLGLAVYLDAGRRNGYLGGRTSIEDASAPN